MLSHTALSVEPNKLEGLVRWCLTEAGRAAPYWLSVSPGCPRRCGNTQALSERLRAHRR